MPFGFGCPIGHTFDRPAVIDEQLETTSFRLTVPSQLAAKATNSSLPVWSRNVKVFSHYIKTNQSDEWPKCSTDTDQIPLRIALRPDATLERPPSKCSLRKLEYPHDQLLQLLIYLNDHQPIITLLLLLCLNRHRFIVEPIEQPVSFYIRRELAVETCSHLPTVCSTCIHNIQVDSSASFVKVNVAGWSQCTSAYANDHWRPNAFVSPEIRWTFGFPQWSAWSRGNCNTRVFVDPIRYRVTQMGANGSAID